MPRQVTAIVGLMSEQQLKENWQNESHLHVELWSSLKIHIRVWRKEPQELLQKHEGGVWTVLGCSVWGFLHTPPQVIVYTDSSVSSAFSCIHHVHTDQLCQTTDQQWYIQVSNPFSDLPSCQGASVRFGLGLNELVFQIFVFHNSSYLKVEYY